MISRPLVEQIVLLNEERKIIHIKGEQLKSENLNLN